MLDFLFTVGQLCCIGSLVSGLILTITHRECVDTLRRDYDSSVNPHRA